MTSDIGQERLKSEYQAGRYAFERGQYRQAVQHLETACGLGDLGSRLGGEVRIWLVTAYEALGEGNKAIALCQQLTKHPHLETRKQAKGLLGILEVPKLRSRPEWRVEIPDLASLDESAPANAKATASKTQRSSPPKRPTEKPQAEIDLSQVNLKDNSFIWVALGLSGIILAGLVWWS
ncbi:tetratricopeptide repeat protein [[Phormidium] sp. ETS-05]|uniref:tetratricopeptide repeat protein n=1 Tax=[Phormidium] sp. ETS-05 TaxID=222819 RepID=UPI0018EECE6B|nr:tetratricopeptide repeat protein [[Phormidium] sp. ETS-05]